MAHRYMPGDKDSEKECDKKDKTPYPPPTFSKDDDWVKENIKQFGEEPSFF